MRKLLVPGVFLLFFYSPAFAYFWTSAVPNEIHITPNGLVIVGEFDQTGITCATGPRAVFVPGIDPMFKEKLTLALTAKATHKKIRTVIEKPTQYSCVQVPGTGYVPVVSSYFWQLID